jgi:hypothetical protein
MRGKLKHTKLQPTAEGNTNPDFEEGFCLLRGKEIPQESRVQVFVL